MKEFSSLADGQEIQALICFTDITNFAQVAKSKTNSEVADMLRDLATTIDNHLEPTKGWIVKYIGDASLIVFPDECVDEGICSLLDLKQVADSFFMERDLPNRFTFAAHFGAVTVVKLPPVQGLDILGDTINIAARLEGGLSKGRFVISPQVFRKLSPQTRKKFHRYTPPIVYYAE